MPPEIFTRKFLLTYWERSGKEKNGEQQEENCKREGGKLKTDGKKVGKWAEDLCFCFVFLAFHFLKHLKFVVGLPKWEFSTAEKHFTPAEKMRKLAPSGKYSSYSTVQQPQNSSVKESSKENFAVY